MSIKISCLSQKGGVGKSTLIRALAVEFAKNDWAVKIADMDIKQRTATDWNCIRMQNNIEPVIAVEPFSKVRDALKQHAAYDVMLFDASGQSDAQTLEIAVMCDLNILPCGIARDDLLPQVRLAHELTRAGIDNKRIVFSISRAGDSKVEQDAAVQYINEAGYKMLGIVREKVSISKCQDIGLAANETRYKSVNKEVDDLIQNIGNLINQIT